MVHRSRRPSSRERLIERVEANPRVTFRTVHEDADILVVEKPAGTVSTPGKAHADDSLLNGLFATHGDRLRQVGAGRDFGMLQRLDREASGLMVIALNANAWESIRAAFTDKRVSKFYWAVTRRAPAQGTGMIRRPLEEYMAPRSDLWIEDPARRRFAKVKLVRVSSRGKPAVTAFRTLGSNQSGALIECRTFTGRLHQVRAHLDSIGCSILGDRFYGPVASRSVGTRLALHAHRLTFPHPGTGEPADFRSRCPRDLRRLLTQLRLDPPGVFSGVSAQESSDEALPEDG
ncbi:MAG: RluA family pseudouridine synthase [Phycisphaerales bacterium]